MAADMNFALDDEKLNKSNVKVNLLLKRSKKSTVFVKPEM